MVNKLREIYCTVKCWKQYSFRIKNALLIGTTKGSIPCTSIIFSTSNGMKWTTWMAVSQKMLELPRKRQLQGLKFANEERGKQSIEVSPRRPSILYTKNKYGYMVEFSIAWVITRLYCHIQLGWTFVYGYSSPYYCLRTDTGKLSEPMQKMTKPNGRRAFLEINCIT